MRNFLNAVIGIFTISFVFGQTLPHNSCETALSTCKETGISITGVFPSMSECEAALTPVYFKLIFSGAGTLELNTGAISGTYTLYGPVNSSQNLCEKVSLGQISQVSDNLSGFQYISHSQGYYILKVSPSSCISMGGGTAGVQIEAYSRLIVCDDTVDCADCISSFSPDPGKYVVSAWVKGEVANKNTSYENPELEVSFVGAPGTFSFTPSGKIIDDWQRIDGIVTIPQNATDIIIKLDCQNGTCYFDDIRFVPVNGSMISYVYDPINLRLVAQLDERNYATLYEYDEEGKLIRVKKETERGIMTIQENRDNIHKR